MSPIDWKNAPDTSTPLSAANLNAEFGGVRTRLDSAEKNQVGEHVLASGTAIGATSLTLDRACAPFGVGWFVAIDGGTVNCELRKVTSVTSGVTLAVLALDKAHAVNAPVHFFEASASVAWFAPAGTGATNDAVALQAAIEQALKVNVWLDGQNRTYGTLDPILLPNGLRLENANVKAMTGFTGTYPDTGVLMGRQGNRRDFTAAAATDTFTTATAHGLPSDGVGVMFTGASLPSPIVRGRLYWCFARTTLDFKVALTTADALAAIGVDLTTDGAGEAHCEAMSLQKLHARHVNVDCSTLPNVNGWCMNLQQISEVEDFRVSGVGVGAWGCILSGQQAKLENTQVLGSDNAGAGNGWLLANASFFDFVGGWNVEKVVTACRVAVVDEISWAPGGGAYQCAWPSYHVEMTGGDVGRTVFDLHGSHRALTFGVGAVTMQITGQKVFHVHAGTPVSSGYEIGPVFINGSGPSAKPTMLLDEDRGHTISAWDYNPSTFGGIVAASKPSSSVYLDQGPWTVLLPGGGMIRQGSANDSLPKFVVRAGTSWGTLADLVRAEKTDGSRASGIAVDGSIFTKMSAAPTSANMENGEVRPWWDATGGAIRWRGKKSDGTVVDLIPIDGSLVDAKGDLFVGTAADTVARLAVGTNGHVLTADSTVAAGVKWAAASGGGGGSSQQANGQAGVIVPTLRGWAGGSGGLAANRAGASRFVLEAARTATAILFRVNTAGTGNVDVAIVDAAGNRLGSSGSTAGKKGSANTWQSVALTAGVALVAGTVYYAVLVSDVADGTYAIASITQGMEQAFGATIGLTEGYIKDTAFPVPASLPIGFVSNTPPVLVVI